MSDSPRIAVLLPCHNEQATVAKVVADFRAALPSAEVYVFDNASTDATAAVAADAGATVIPVPQPGKGHVIAASASARTTTSWPTGTTPTPPITSRRCSSR
jgi:glycosyltransferase involved in cell wall biosynthesis